jgi:hypothetical protein
VGIAYPSIDEAFLPKGMSKSQQLACFSRESAFDELHGALKGRACWNCDQKMNVIWHNNKGMELKSRVCAVLVQSVTEELSHALRLEEGHLVPGGSRDEVRGRASLSAVRNGQYTTSAAKATGYPHCQTVPLKRHSTLCST